MHKQYEAAVSCEVRTLQTLRAAAVCTVCVACRPTTAAA